MAGAYDQCVLGDVRLLNEEFAGWVSDALANKPQDIWFKACEDYIAHAQQIVRDAEAAKGKLPNGTPATKDAQVANGKLPNGTFMPLFSEPPKATLPSGPPLAPNPPAPVLNPFNFFQQGPPAVPPAPAPVAEEAMDEEEEPPVEVEIKDESTILFKQPAKFYSQDAEKKWKEHGKGLLTIRQPSDEGRSPYLVFTTETGKVLLNAALYKGLKVVINAGRPHMVTLTLQYTDPGAPDSQPTFKPVLLNLLKGPVADDFKTVVDIKTQS